MSVVEIVDVEREAQFQWDEARWKLHLPPCRLPKDREDFRIIARAHLLKDKSDD